VGDLEVELQCEVSSETLFGIKNMAKRIGKTRKSSASNFQALIDNNPRFDFIFRRGGLAMTQTNSLDAAFQLHQTELKQKRREIANRNLLNQSKSTDVSSGYL
jgi:hypothetical protein